MKSTIALIKREYLEHRGAFLYAPIGLLILAAIVLSAALGLGRMRPPIELGVAPMLTFLKVGFIGASGLWFVYMMASLFFYFADAFNADRRNNAMLFWKSMPVSDFEVLGSKLLAGLTIFPALIFIAQLVTAVLLYVFTSLAALSVPGIAIPGIVDVLTATWQIAVFGLIFLVLALLWYMPFFAWVGGLSTLVGRWSIPLAFLIPGLVGLVENLFIDGGPRGGYVLSFIRDRMTFGPREMAFGPGHFSVLFERDNLDVGALTNALIANIDWTQMAIGWAFALVVIYLASEYRRRVVST